MKRVVKQILNSKTTIEGAGVRLKRVFGYSELPLFDPFLLLDHFGSENPEDCVSARENIVRNLSFCNRLEYRSTSKGEKVLRLCVNWDCIKTFFSELHSVKLAVKSICFHKFCVSAFFHCFAFFNDYDFITEAYGG